MRKQEYLHVHALLLELAVHLAEDGAVSREVVAAQEGRPVDPTAVYASKAAHHDAVMALSEDIATALAPGQEAVGQPSAQ